MMTNKKIGIYIHVPFCLSKCFYCDFCSRVNSNDNDYDLYIKRLVEDIENYDVSKINPQGEYCADTVYFGGGTPTLLDLDKIKTILEAINRKFHVTEDAEITIECNPRTATFEKLCGMRNMGINRLSLGLQSANAEELNSLGRAHGFDDFVEVYQDARRAGFENISVDIMYGIPSQTLDSFKNTLEQVCNLKPEHISSYCLKIEENTVYYAKKDTLQLPCEDDVCDMYEEMVRFLEKKNYSRYEISNFSLINRESRHNLKYWKYDDYIGFAPSAHSFENNVRRSNSRDVRGYLQGKDITEDVVKLSLNERINEYVMLRMRLQVGVNFEEFKRRFSMDFFDFFGDVFEKYKPEYIIQNEDSIFFTQKGMLISNYILSDVLDFEK